MSGSEPLNPSAQKTLFLEARTHNFWLDKPVSDLQLQQIYDLMKWGPTSANSQPARFLFLRSAEAKAKLKPCLAESNVEKTMTAPVTVIVASDPKFYDQLPKQFPHTDARSWFVGNEDLIQQTAFRNSSLQGAYFMLAARALGLDCGPMSGFDPKKVNEAFFAKSQFQANFICNLGYGDNQKLFPRSPRLNFSEACQVL